MILTGKLTTNTNPHGSYVHNITFSSPNISQIMDWAWISSTDTLTESIILETDFEQLDSFIEHELTGRGENVTIKNFSKSFLPKFLTNNTNIQEVEE